ncbi:hypothetical protein [Butyrivibrio sp. AE2032]|uniref:hypothetical protein n=1 Tax=Butyrivibrio sp. AE2032 TaxID=1458463 RepID=UPI00054F51E9|nr:hypothetical protein [Butyrivibrio sp. AE2032]
MKKLTENMIRWAESKLGSTEYAGWCLAFIEDYLAIEKLTALTGDHPEYLGWVTLKRVLDQKPY